MEPIGGRQLVNSGCDTSSLLQSPACSIAAPQIDRGGRRGSLGALQQEMIRRAGARIKNRRQRLPSAAQASVVLERRSDDVAWLSEAVSGEPQDCGTIDKAVYGGNSGGL